MAMLSKSTGNVGSKPSELESIIKSYVWFGPKEILSGGEKISESNFFAYYVAGENITKKAKDVYNASCLDRSIIACVLRKKTEMPNTVALVYKYTFQKDSIIKTPAANAAHMFFLNENMLCAQQLTSLDFLLACDLQVKSKKEAKESYDKFVRDYSIEALQNKRENTLRSMNDWELGNVAKMAGHFESGRWKRISIRDNKQGLLPKFLIIAAMLLHNETSCEYYLQRDEEQDFVTAYSLNVQHSDKADRVELSTELPTWHAEFYTHLLYTLNNTGIPVRALLPLAKKIKQQSTDASIAKGLFNSVVAALQVIPGEVVAECNRYKRYGSPDDVSRLTEELKLWRKEAGQYGIGQPSELVEHIKKLGGLRIEAENNYRQSEEKAKQSEEKARQIQGMLGRFKGVAAKFGKNDSEDLGAFIDDLCGERVRLYAARQSDSNHITALENELAAAKQEKSVLETKAERYEEHREYYAAGQALLAANTPEQLRENVAALRMRATMFAEIERNLVANGGAIDLRGLRRLEEKLRETYRSEGAERRD